MALINPCNIAATSSNTGVECSDALRATSAIILVPKKAFWAESDLSDFTSYINTKLHASAGSRWYILFGSAAPVRSINSSNEADVIETLDDGSKQFIRRGYYNREFVSTDGGMCWARHLFGIIGQNYGFIEVDIDGKVAMKENVDGSFGPFPLALAYAPSPELADLKTSYKNKFMLSFSPNDYIKRGKVFASDSTEDIIDLKGLLDVQLAAGDAATTTALYVTVTTLCGSQDIGELYAGTGAGHIAQVSNFVVINEDGTTNTPSSAAMQGTNQVKLNGTYATGTDITVSLAAPSVLKANGIEGYEGVKSVVLSIP